MNFKYKVLLILGAIIFIFGGGYLLGKGNSKEIENYNRQLQGQLSDKEREMQQLNKDIGVAHSELMSQKELAAKLKKENEEYDKKFIAFIKKHDLEISSRDKTIAELKQLMAGGETEVIVGEGCTDLNNSNGKCTLTYSWQDNYKRFKLTDPNVFEKNNEKFESSQIFKIYGEVYQQKEGSLQTRRIVLREIHKKEDGTYEEIPEAKAEILDAQFEYTNPPAEEKTKSIFRPRIISFGTVGIVPNAGSTQLGLGAELLSFKNVGISTGFGFDFEEFKKSELKVGIEYNPSFLNIGFGPFLGTPIDNFGKDYTLSMALLFYITN